MDEFAPPDLDARSSARATLLDWLEELEQNPIVAAVVEDTESDAERWFVRVNGEAKDVYSVWFELAQRTLRVESYVLPWPEENHAALFEQLLRRNDSMRDLAFTIGQEDAIFLKARIDLRRVDSEVLDRLLGSIYEAVERSFAAAVRVGFARRFTS